eukprot:11956144-Alexandrium_andersonii.AAC.1
MVSHRRRACSHIARQTMSQTMSQNSVPRSVKSHTAQVRGVSNPTCHMLERFAGLPPDPAPLNCSSCRLEYEASRAAQLL